MSLRLAGCGGPVRADEPLDSDSDSFGQKARLSGSIFWASEPSWAWLLPLRLIATSISKLEPWLHMVFFNVSYVPYELLHLVLLKTTFTYRSHTDHIQIIYRLVEKLYTNYIQITYKLHIWHAAYLPIKYRFHIVLTVYLPRTYEYIWLFCMLQMQIVFLIYI